MLAGNALSLAIVLPITVVPVLLQFDFADPVSALPLTSLSIS